MPTTEPNYTDCQEYSVENVYDYSIKKPKHISYDWISYAVLIFILICMYRFLNYIFIPKSTKNVINNV